MKIIPANLKDQEEVKNIIDIIYTIFLSSNIKDSTERLIQRMQLLYGPEYNYEYTLAHFKKSSIFFIAKEQNHIIGMVRGNPEKLSNLYILKERQGKGIGRRLLEKFENTAKEMGSTAIALKSSKHALPFYTKNGYIITQENRMIKYL